MVATDGSAALIGSRANRAEAFVASKRDRLFAPHVAPLNRLVEELVAIGHPAPWVDPDGGGIHSRILFLLESPGPMASSAHGSGFISVDNNDPTAERCWRLGAEAGLSRASYASWNLVPWYVSSTRKNRTRDRGTRPKPRRGSGSSSGSSPSYASSC